MFIGLLVWKTLPEIQKYVGEEAIRVFSKKEKKAIRVSTTCETFQIKGIRSPDLLKSASQKGIWHFLKNSMHPSCQM